MKSQSCRRALPRRAVTMVTAGRRPVTCVHSGRPQQEAFTAVAQPPAQVAVDERKEYEINALRPASSEQPLNEGSGSGGAGRGHMSDCVRPPPAPAGLQGAGWCRAPGVGAHV